MISGKTGSKRLSDDLALMKGKSKEETQKLFAENIGLAKSLAYRLSMQIVYIGWLLIGLLTFNWWIYSIIFALSLIPKKHTLWIRVDAALTIFLVIFALFNTAVLKFDMTQYLSHLLNF
jgi:hypothetical protein